MSKQLGLFVNHLCNNFDLIEYVLMKIDVIGEFNVLFELCLRMKFSATDRIVSLGKLESVFPSIK